jgi:lysyl-tRNA synthetase class 2
MGKIDVFDFFVNMCAGLSVLVMNSLRQHLSVGNSRAGSHKICFTRRLRVDFVPLFEIGESNMSETATWQPSASIPNLLKRAAIMAEIRRFFSDRGVLEVETPCMSQATVTDIHMFPFETRFVGPGHSQGMDLYLMTSPEYHMKRLLAAGCGPVFQLCRSFRNEEMGRHHNPEFTMLEWYRPCYDMYRLINEVDDLAAAGAGVPAGGKPLLSAGVPASSGN